MVHMPHKTVQSSTCTSTLTVQITSVSTWERCTGRVVLSTVLNSEVLATNEIVTAAKHCTSLEVLYDGELGIVAPKPCDGRGDLKVLTMKNKVEIVDNRGKHLLYGI